MLVIEPGTFRNVPISVLRYASEQNGAGSFLTKSNYSDVAQAVSGLNLEPTNNLASYKQVVMVEKPTLVLEGKIAGSGDGSVQSIVLEKDSFVFQAGESIND